MLVGCIAGRFATTLSINQSQCTFPRFVIGLVLLLLLPTPTIWFSLDQKRNVSDGVVSGIGTLFSLDISSTLLITTPTPTPSLVKTSLYQVPFQRLEKHLERKYTECSAEWRRENCGNVRE